MIHRTFTGRAVPVGFLLLLLLLLLAGVAGACNVPVFRYALERWRADSYRVVLIHRGPLSETDKVLVAPWEEGPNREASHFDFHAVDIDAIADPADRQLLASLGITTLPALVVQYPERMGMEAPIRTRPFNRAEVAALMDSPVRKELVRRLVEGQSAVWLLLECGDRAQDDDAGLLLHEELKRLERELKLPVLTDDPADNLQAGPPLRVEFSVLRVPRSEDEGLLIDMLLHSEDDLADRTVPLIFPVFGRGRALFPIVGVGITAGNIDEYGAFLVGACSCEVKDQNPGFDLLLSANWEELLAQQGVPAAVLAPPTPATPELVPIPAGAGHSNGASHEAPLAGNGPSQTLWPWGIGLAAACLAALLLLVPVMRR